MQRPRPHCPLDAGGQCQKSARDVGKTADPARVVELRDVDVVDFLVMVHFAESERPDPERVVDCTPDPFRLPAEAALGLPTDPFHLRISSIEAQASLTGHLERIERDLGAAAPAMDRAVTGYGLLVSAWMERELTRAEGAILREKTHRLAELFGTMMESRFRSGRGIADYAEALQVTPTHLSRICREAAGRPAHALLTERIMYEARRLLRDTDMPAREVAETLGFSSAAYFTRAFQQSTGRTPSEFRAPRNRA